MFQPLKIRDFRAYWIGQVISLSGTWMQHIAQSWLVYVITNSAFYLGLISFLSSFPMLIFTLFGGVVADRYSRKKILVLTQIFSLFPALFLGIIIHLNKVEIWHVAVASLVLGIASAFDMPARQAFITEIVSKEMITSAVAMQSMSFNIARIVGPFLAGVIVTNLNFHMCFYLNAISFLPLIVILRWISEKNIPATTENSSVKHFFKEGLAFLLERKRILFTISAVGIFTVFGVSFIPVLPVIAKEVLGRGVEGYSMLVTSIGIGSLTAGTIIAIRKDIQDKEKHIFLASLIFPVGLFGIAFSENFYLTIIFAFLLGMSFVNFFTVSNSFIQHQTESRLRGRVMSFFSFVFLGFTPFGNMLMGVLVENFGTRMVISLCALVCMISSVVFFKILPSYFSSGNETS
ncbi:MULTISPECIES: MFS transporter [Thermodesulfovibrio]|jgi:MFS family permease|uniref:MFS transporter n=1 Tax=Thermodesulfovibrio TaxID=28261 RepID=UPI002632EA2F|nr:MFS transporter [Thermodesulfovibrio sp.]